MRYLILLILAVMWWPGLCFGFGVDQVGSIGRTAITQGGPISLDTSHALGNPIAAYVLEESATTGTGDSILDLTANNKDLILSGGYTREPTGGVTFNGTSGTAVGNHSSVNNYPLTLVATFKAAATPMWVLNLCNSSTTNNIISLAGRESTTIKPSAVVFHVAFNESLGSTTLIAGNTYTVVAVLTSATDRKIYLNGVIEGSFATEFTYPITELNRISLGALADNTPAYGSGTIISAYLYNYALTQAQAESLSGNPFQIITNYAGPR